MDLVINSKRSMLFVVVALCGQVKRKYLSQVDGSVAQTNRIINEMLEDDVFVLKEVGRVKVVRLKMPAAQNILDEISGLDAFYEKLTDGNHFKTTPRTVGIRKLKSSTIAFMCFMSDISIGGINVRRRNGQTRRALSENAAIQNNENRKRTINTSGRVETEDPAEKQVNMILCDIEVYNDSYENAQSYVDRIREVNKDRVHFFYTTDVKRYADSAEETGILNINSSRSFGHIIGSYNSYAVYYIESEKEKYADAVERRYRNHLEEMFRIMYGKDVYEIRKKKSPKGECIIVYESEKKLTAIIRMLTDKNSTRTMPVSLYSKSYAVPIVGRRLEMLTKRDWKQELLKRVFTISETEDAKDTGLEWCDAVINDTPAIELYSMDLNKIITTLRLLDQSGKLKLKIACEKEDENLIAEIYRPYAKQIEILTNR